MPEFNRWQSKAEALARLCIDQLGQPEGELAREKLFEILRGHPETRPLALVREYVLMGPEMTLDDLSFLEEIGVMA